MSRTSVQSLLRGLLLSSLLILLIAGSTLPGGASGFMDHWQTQYPGETAGGGIQLSLMSSSLTESGGAISGHVTDLDGNPIEGATVGVQNEAPGRTIASTTTNANGFYRFSDLPSGEYYLWFDAEGYLPKWYGDVWSGNQSPAVIVEAPNETTGIDIALTAGGMISGRVTDTAGNPMPDIRVECHGDTVSLGRTTNSSGYYEIILPYGTYTVVAATGLRTDDGSLATQEQTGVVLDSTNYLVRVDFALEPVSRGAGISGLITDPFGSPISGSLVYVVNLHGWTVDVDWTDPVGSYTVSNLYSGDYRVVATADGYLHNWYGDVASGNSATIFTTMAPDTASGIDIMLEPVNFLPPTIVTDLPETAAQEVETPFSIGLLAGNYADTSVRLRLSFAAAEQVDAVELMYEDGGAFVPLTLENGTAWYGSESGFPLADLTLNCIAKFNAAGTYPYTFEIVNQEYGTVMASVEGSVEVREPATLEIRTSGMGTVEISDPGPYFVGQEVTVSAIPDPSWAFHHWTGDIRDGSSSIVIVLTSETRLMAHFVRSPEKPIAAPPGETPARPDPPRIEKDEDPQAGSGQPAKKPEDKPGENRGK